MLSSQSPSIYTVSRLNQTVRLLLEQEMGQVWISGEISNFTQPSSGHWYFTLKDDTAQVVVNNNDPTYKSEHTDTLVYNPEGALSYRLIAQHVEYYSDQAVSWFTQPVLTTFDKDKIPTWSVKADKAKLTNDRMLYLYGHVEVNALVPDSQLRRITTDNAQINLVTQDVTSEDLVTLYGTTFNSSGLKMRGNLRSKNAELIEKVRTSYEIQNKQTQP